MRHHFGRSLKVGQAGEDSFHKLWPELERLDGRKADFKTPDGKLLEVKSDMYDMNNTVNFFIEYISNLAKGTNGGPFQSLDNGVELFVYYFPVNKTYFIFDTKELCIKVRQIMHQCQVRNIQNTRHTTIGLMVPRELLKEIYKEIKA